MRRGDAGTARQERNARRAGEEIRYRMSPVLGFKAGIHGPQMGETHSKNGDRFLQAVSGTQLHRQALSLFLEAQV